MSLATNIANRMPEWFRQLPIGQQVVTQAKAEQSATRQQHIDGIAKTTAQLEKALPALDAKIAAAATKQKAAEQAMRDAKAVLNRAINERMGVVNSSETVIARHVEALRATADVDTIEAFHREMSDQWQRERAAWLDTITGQTTQRGIMVFVGTNNKTALAARLARFGEIVRDEAPRLYLVPDSELPARIAELRDSIPEAHECWDDPKLAAQIKSSGLVAVAE